MKLIAFSLCLAVALAASNDRYQSSQAYNPYASYQSGYNQYDNQYSNNGYSDNYNDGYSSGKSYDNKNYKNKNSYGNKEYNGGNNYDNNGYNQYDNGYSGNSYDNGYSGNSYDNGYNGNNYDNNGYDNNGYNGKNYEKKGYNGKNYNQQKSYGNNYNNNDYQCPSLPSLYLVKPKADSNIVQYVGSGSTVAAYCGHKDEDEVAVIYVKCPNGKCVLINTRGAGLEEQVTFYCQKTGKWALLAGSYDFVSVGGYSVTCSKEGNAPKGCDTPDTDLAVCLEEEESSD